jgi:dolichol-phosphate mannosyltransferase
MKKVAIIPAYNEEKTIAHVVDDLKNNVDEVVVVNDGSTDRTLEIIKNLGIVVVSHATNRGYGEALRSGYQKGLEIDGDVFLLIDADLQHDTKEATKLMDFLIKNNQDIVIGSRFLQNKSRIPLYRRFGIRVFTILTRVFIGVKLTDAQSGFRVFTRKAVEKIIDFKNGDMGSSIEILYLAKKHKLKIAEYPITCSYENVEYSVNPIMHGLQLINILLRLSLMGNARGK